MPSQTHISIPKRVFVAFGICWLAALLLSVIYGVRLRVVGHASLESLWYLGIVAFVVLRCLVLAALTTPLVAWTLRSYAVLKWHLVLFAGLVVWTLSVKPMPGARFLIFGGLLLSYIGLVVIRFSSQR
jgi:hypothetical protein